MAREAPKGGANSAHRHAALKDITNSTRVVPTSTTTSLINATPIPLPTNHNLNSSALNTPIVNSKASKHSSFSSSKSSHHISVVDPIANDTLDFSSFIKCLCVPNTLSPIHPYQQPEKCSMRLLSSSNNKLAQKTNSNLSSETSLDSTSFLTPSINRDTINKLFLDNDDSRSTKSNGDGNLKHNIDQNSSNQPNCDIALTTTTCPSTLKSSTITSSSTEKHFATRDISKTLVNGENSTKVGQSVGFEFGGGVMTDGVATTSQHTTTISNDWSLSSFLSHEETTSAPLGSLPHGLTPQVPDVKKCSKPSSNSDSHVSVPPKKLGAANNHKKLSSELTPTGEISSSASKTVTQPSKGRGINAGKAVSAALLPNKEYRLLARKKTPSPSSHSPPHHPDGVDGAPTVPLKTSSSEVSPVESNLNVAVDELTIPSAAQGQDAISKKQKLSGLPNPAVTNSTKTGAMEGKPLSSMLTAIKKEVSSADYSDTVNNHSSSKNAGLSSSGSDTDNDEADEDFCPKTGGKKGNKILKQLSTGKNVAVNMNKSTVAPDDKSSGKIVPIASSSNPHSSSALLKRSYPTEEPPHHQTIGENASLPSRHAHSKKVKVSCSSSQSLISTTKTVVKSEKMITEPHPLKKPTTSTTSTSSKPISVVTKGHVSGRSSNNSNQTALSIYEPPTELLSPIPPALSVAQPPTSLKIKIKREHQQHTSLSSTSSVNRSNDSGCHLSASSTSSSFFDSSSTIKIEPPEKVSSNTIPHKPLSLIPSTTDTARTSVREDGTVSAPTNIVRRKRRLRMPATLTVQIELALIKKIPILPYHYNGCSTSVPVVQSIPTPLLQQQPISGENLNIVGGTGVAIAPTTMLIGSSDLVGLESNGLVNHRNNNGTTHVGTSTDGSVVGGGGGGDLWGFVDPMSNMVGLNNNNNLCSSRQQQQRLSMTSHLHHQQQQMYGSANNNDATTVMIMENNANMLNMANNNGMAAGQLGFAEASAATQRQLALSATDNKYYTLRWGQSPAPTPMLPACWPSSNAASSKVWAEIGLDPDRFPHITGHQLHRIAKTLKRAADHEPDKERKKYTYFDAVTYFALYGDYIEQSNSSGTTNTSNGDISEVDSAALHPTDNTVHRAAVIYNDTLKLCNHILDRIEKSFDSRTDFRDVRYSRNFCLAILIYKIQSCLHYKLWQTKKKSSTMLAHSFPKVFQATTPKTHNLFLVNQDGQNPVVGRLAGDSSQPSPMNLPNPTGTDDVIGSSVDHRLKDQINALQNLALAHEFWDLSCQMTARYCSSVAFCCPSVSVTNMAARMDMNCLNYQSHQHRPSPFYNPPPITHHPLQSHLAGGPTNQNGDVVSYSQHNCCFGTVSQHLGVPVTVGGPSWHLILYIKYCLHSPTGIGYTPSSVVSPSNNNSANPLFYHLQPNKLPQASSMQPSRGSPYDFEIAFAPPPGAPNLNMATAAPIVVNIQPQQQQQQSNNNHTVGVNNNNNNSNNNNNNNNSSNNNGNNNNHHVTGNLHVMGGGSSTNKMMNKHHVSSQHHPPHHQHAP